MKKYNKNSVLTMVAVFLVFGLAATIAMKTSKNNKVVQQGIVANKEKEMVLNQSMRRLWADHVIWTREYINGTLDGAPGTDEAAKRLLKNQEDIGDAIATYYSADAGAKLTSLLKDHIQIAVTLVTAAKIDDVEGFKNANTRWKTNAEDIATFLSSANSNWPKATLDEAMAMHLKTTTDEVTSRLNKQYDVSVASFDDVFDHIQTMADMLTAGIIKQFPDKF